MTFSDNPAETEVTYLKGVGPKRAAGLNTIGIATVEDLLYHFPRRYLDRSKMMKIAELTLGAVVTVIGRVRTHGLLRARKPYYEVLISDETGTLPLIWFGPLRFLDLLSKSFKSGMTLSVAGTVGEFHGLQIVRPEYEVLFESEEEEKLHTGRIIPLYPSSAELKDLYLDSRGMRRIIKHALEDYAGKVVDILPATVAAELKLLPLDEALQQMHYPKSFAGQEQARRDLALRELLLFQIGLAYRRKRITQIKKPQTIKKPDQEFSEIAGKLPFTLTTAQNRVITEILADLFKPNPMQRLLQGDVGSGKTVVAALTAAQVIRSGYQAAIMAPTEILAHQHFHTVREILQKNDMRVELLTGSTSLRDRQGILRRLRQGEIDLVIGTHALITEDVAFHNLSYIVVDEQHRFGVEQRQKLFAKGQAPDTLVMTATPIPRTLAMTAYGDLDLSIIDQLPSGRRPVRTALRTGSDRPKIYHFIREEVTRENQVFFIYPLVEESPRSEMKAATQAFRELSEEIFPDLRVGLVHGQLKSKDRERVMKNFSDGAIGILVATTVVEVGIDIPDATVMVIEHAERFGLSQLHQLRGRVGRSDKKSYCVLLTDAEPSAESYQRLERFVGCVDGFELSELDLELRGPGDLLGVRQSGMPIFKVASLAKDLNLILTARETASKLMENRYAVSAEEKQTLRSFIRKVTLSGVVAQKSLG